jgi:hypothetical protein
MLSCGRPVARRQRAFARLRHRGGAQQVAGRLELGGHPFAQFDGLAKAARGTAAARKGIVDRVQRLSRLMA